MRVKNLHCEHYRIPLSHPMQDATHGLMTDFDVVMVKLESETGQLGLGYTYTVHGGGGAIRSLVENELKSIVLGTDPNFTEKTWDAIWRRLHYIGRGGLVSFAMSAVDIALWDLKARQANLPLWILLGGYNRNVHTYAGGIDLHLDPDELVKQMQRTLDAGFRAIKIKVGRDRLSEDVERVRAVRECIGSELPLMLDANMLWTVDQAIRAARKFSEFDIFWLEEPTIPDDYPGMARIAAEGGIPVAAGENLRTIYEFRHTLEWGKIAFPEPDVSNIGGITNWMRVAKLAYAFNLPVTSHGVHELHLHLLAAIPNASYLEVHSFGLERFMKDPPTLQDGMMRAPDAPGHGVAFDWDHLREYRVS